MAEKIRTKSEVVVCENCGASFDSHEEMCPFCGFINAIGAEEKYMQKMQAIKSDLAEVDDEQIKEIKNEAKKSIKVVIITVLVLAIVIVVLAIVYVVDRKVSSRAYEGIKLYEDDPIEAAKWNDSNLEQLDEMYAKGDIDGLVDFYDKLVRSGEYGAFHSWEHSFVISQIYDLRFWTNELEKDDKIDSLVLHSIMFNLLYYYNGDYNGTNMPEEDKVLVLEEVQKQIENLSGRINITTDILEDMRQHCLSDGGYVNPALVSEYCDKHKELFE